MEPGEVILVAVASFGAAGAMALFEGEGKDEVRRVALDGLGDDGVLLERIEVRGGAADGDGPFEAELVNGQHAYEVVLSAADKTPLFEPVTSLAGFAASLLAPGAGRADRTSVAFIRPKFPTRQSRSRFPSSFKVRGALL